jgi:hypothetical protein
MEPTHIVQKDFTHSEKYRATAEIDNILPKNRYDNIGRQ